MMKKLICEICGSADLLKKDGVFECQSCGCKYSVEEAKKMIIEDTIKIDGVVKTENVDFEIRAGELIAYHGAETNVVIPEGVKIIGEKCFMDMQGIESITIPNSVTKIRVQAFFGCTSLQSIYVPDSVLEIQNLAFGDTYSLTDVHLPPSFSSEDALRLASHGWIYLDDEDGNSKVEFLEWISSPWFSKEYDAEKAKQQKTERIAREQHFANENKSGCYVATSVYGSYDCPQVWTLRRFRDDTLAKTWYGRVFIRVYYAVSPTLVKWFGHTEWFTKMWKGKLDHMVYTLNSKGVENTPYKDKAW